jgi:cycloeucalenol cycloisomerase
MSWIFSSDVDVAVKMAAILGTLVAGIVGLSMLQTPATTSKTDEAVAREKTIFLPDPNQSPTKRAYEIFVAAYTPVWIGAFAVVVAFQLYEDFTPEMYIYFCGGLALPFLLQPIILPGAGQNSPDAKRPLLQRYAFKANVWLAVYSCIGNYWYTHYFYSVLQATYTMPNAIRINNVPIAMFLATHFYFSTYHLFSNCMLRKIVTTYRRTIWRDLLFVSSIGVFSYFTAFMETLTISSYPYYTFRDRNMAYVVGSAFYGIYFIVSFPAFFFFDNKIDQKGTQAVGVWETIVSSCGYGMMIMFLLDFVRLYVDIPLVVGASISNLQKISE